MSSHPSSSTWNSQASYADLNENHLGRPSTPSPKPSLRTSNSSNAPTTPPSTRSSSFCPPAPKSTCFRRTPNRFQPFHYVDRTHNFFWTPNTPPSEDFREHDHRLYELVPIEQPLISMTQFEHLGAAMSQLGLTGHANSPSDKDPSFISKGKRKAMEYLGDNSGAMIQLDQRFANMTFDSALGTLLEKQSKPFTEMAIETESSTMRQLHRCMDDLSIAKKETASITTAQSPALPDRKRRAPDRKRTAGDHHTPLSDALFSVRLLQHSLLTTHGSTNEDQEMHDFLSDELQTESDRRRIEQEEENRRTVERIRKKQESDKRSAERKKIRRERVRAKLFLINSQQH